MRYFELTKIVYVSVNMTMMRMLDEMAEKHPGVSMRIVSHSLYMLLDRATYLSIIFSIEPK